MADLDQRQLLQAGPVMSPRDLLPEGAPYYPDWGIDWDFIDEVEPYGDEFDCYGSLAHPAEDLDDYHPYGED